VPLRDHFHPPVENVASWEEVHGAWPATIAYRLNATLPTQYRCGVKVHVGMLVEVDIATFERDIATEPHDEATNGTGHSWESESPTLLLESEELAPPEYEVRVYDSTRAQRLVAVVELVSPGNKDRPETRRAFIAKCLSYLSQGIGLIVVDVVTERTANLHDELVRWMGLGQPYLFPPDARIYSVSYRPRRGVEPGGQPLPSLPLLLRGGPEVPIDLEAAYTEARDRSRI
jgi:hypothetical protein